MIRYVALLRGINVGGNNIIKMSELKDVLTKNGFSDVTTYIQSGNVIFSSDERNSVKLTEQLELILSKAFHYTSKVILVSDEQLKEVLADVPAEWKKQNDLRCYISFMKDSVVGKDVINEVPLNAEVDSLKAGKHVLYMTTKMSGLTKSGFTKLIGKKIYQEITIRNYNTSRKLLELMESVK